MKTEADNCNELSSVLRELSDAFPDMRFGQLIVNLSYLAREPSHSATWETEDDVLLIAARQMLANQRQAVCTD